MMSWFLLVPARVQMLVSLLLSFFLRNGVLFHHDFLLPGGSGSGAGACLPSSFFFLPARVPVIVPLLLSSFFSQERGFVPS